MREGVRWSRTGFIRVTCRRRGCKQELGKSPQSCAWGLASRIWEMLWVEGSKRREERCQEGGRVGGRGGQGSAFAVFPSFPTLPLFRPLSDLIPIVVAGELHG